MYQFTEINKEHLSLLTDRFKNFITLRDKLDPLLEDILNTLHDDLKLVPTSSCESHPGVDKKSVFYITFIYTDRTNLLLNEWFDLYTEDYPQHAVSTGLSIKIKHSISSSKTRVDKRISFIAHISNEESKMRLIDNLNRTLAKLVLAYKK